MNFIAECWLKNSFYPDLLSRDFNSKGIARSTHSYSIVDFNPVSAPVPLLHAGFSVNDNGHLSGALGNLATVAVGPGDRVLCVGSVLTFATSSTNAAPIPSANGSLMAWR